MPRNEKRSIATGARGRSGAKTASSGTSRVILLALLGAVVAPLLARLGRKGDGKKPPKANKPPVSAVGGAKPMGRSESSIPRNKQSNNKKSKARRKENRAMIEAKRREDEAKAKAEAEKAEKARKGNNVPKAADVVGGEAGKTFTTTSHVKVSTWAHDIDARRASGM